METFCTPIPSVAFEANECTFLYTYVLKYFKAITQTRVGLAVARHHNKAILNSSHYYNSKHY